MKSCMRLWFAMLLAAAFSYEWIDRPLCEWIYSDHFPRLFSFAAGVVEWPPVITAMAPLMLIIAWFLPSGRPRRLLCLMGFSVIVVFILKNDLKWVFSRYWPMTWTHQNPSWISNHAYGFQWFQGRFLQGSDQTGSFPSGHSAVAFAACMSAGIVYRRLMPVMVALASLEALSMVAFDYHFLSDVIAGSLLGSVTVLMVGGLIDGRLIKEGEPAS